MITRRDRNPHYGLNCARQGGVAQDPGRSAQLDQSSQCRLVAVALDELATRDPPPHAPAAAAPARSEQLLEVGPAGQCERLHACERHRFVVFARRATTSARPQSSGAGIPPPPGSDRQRNGFMRQRQRSSGVGSSVGLCYGSHNSPSSTTCGGDSDWNRGRAIHIPRPRKG
jgi:hypothetical protein